MKTKDKYFEIFWKAYPRKVGKKYAKQVWDRKIKLEQIGAVLEGLEAYKTSLEWLKDGGQYIPHPSTFLNGERWEDDVQDMSFLKFPESESEVYDVLILNQVGIKNYLLSLADLVEYYRRNEKFLHEVKSYCQDIVLALVVLQKMQKEFEAKGFTWNLANLSKNFRYNLELYEYEMNKKKRGERNAYRR